MKAENIPREKIIRDIDDEEQICPCGCEFTGLVKR